MCIHVKSDGTQCGIDNHDGDYCHLHEPEEDDEGVTKEMEEGYKSLSVDENEPLSLFVDPEDSGICNGCEMPVRRAVGSVKESKYKPKHVTVEEVFRCGCDSVTIDAKEYRKSDVPDGWY